MLDLEWILLTGSEITNLFTSLRVEAFSDTHLLRFHQIAKCTNGKTENTFPRLHMIVMGKNKSDISTPHCGDTARMRSVVLARR